MRILIISTSDCRGGAAKVAFRLGNVLRRNGHDVLLYVANKQTSESWIVESKTPRILKKLNQVLDCFLGILFSGDKNMPFTLGLMGETLDAVIKDFKPDIINVHWTGKGFVSFSEIVKQSKRNKLVWTLHDWNAFSGGYFFEIEDFKKNIFLNLLEKWNIGRKKRIIGDTVLNVVTPSKFLGELAKNSEVLRNAEISIINNGIDTNVFKRNDRTLSRGNWNLDEKKYYLLFGSVNIKNDRAKGFDILLKTLMLKKDFLEKNSIGLISFGSEDPFSHTVLKDFDLEKRFLGYIKDESSLSELYSASNLLLFPSKIENYPLTILECLASGTRVLAFNVGGISEIIDNNKGMIVTPFNVKILGDTIEKEIIEKKSVKDIEICSLEEMGSKYFKLFLDCKAGIN